MICQRCADAADQRTPHDGCPGETWCDCQHMAASPPIDIKDTEDIEVTA